MKTFKKISAGILLSVVIVAGSLLASHKASAAGGYMTGKISASSISLSFKDRTTISGTVNGMAVTYVDSDPTDTTYNYVVQGSGIFCNPGTPSNITILNNDIALSTGGSANVQARFDARTSTDGTNNGCTISNSIPFNVGNPGAGMNLLQWQPSGNLQIINGDSLTEVGTSDIYEKNPSSSCGGGTAAVVSGSGATTYSLSSSPPSRTEVAPSASSFPNLATSSLSSCYVYKINNQGLSFSSDAQALAKQQYGIAGSRPTPGTGAVGTTTGSLAGTSCDQSQAAPSGYSCSCTSIGINAGTTSCSLVAVSSAPLSTTSDDTSACLANSHTSLEWVFCPVTTTLSKAVEVIDQFINGQLHFDVNGNLSNSGSIHLAWSIIREIASTLIIILLLVMVISQAIGGNLFDAYTVRKMLPRLVIAVIAMQVSWELCKWLIGLANDAGDGLGQIMTAPFGSGGNMDLNSILHQFQNPAWAGIAQISLFTAFVGGAILAAVALPGVMVAAFGLFIGVFAALMVLLFRNVLIVALTIFSPLAFLVWSASTSQGGLTNLWKMWKENFTKLLMLFPLLIAIIYTGRIFAWTVANSNHGAKAGFIDYLTVLVAYFGPYFIIFRAYKWGGSMLSAAGTGIAAARKGITNANSGWLKTMGERAQGNLADRYKTRTATEREIQDAINKRKAQGKPTDQLEAKLKKTQQRPFSMGRRFGIPLPRPNSEWMKNYALRIGAGTPLPTERQKVETLAKAGTYKKDLVDKKQALMHTDFVEEMSRNGGNVGKAKEFVRNRYGLDNFERDAATGKIFTDANGDPIVKDKYTDRAFNNWLVDTNSWMELGDPEWRMGAIKGKIDKAQFMPGGRYASMNRAISQGRGAAVVDRTASLLAAKEHVIGYETDPTLTTEDILLKGKKPKLDIAKTTGFMGMMNADGQRYRAVAEKFPLFQPFNQELGGGPKRQDYIPALVDATGAVIVAGAARASAESAVNVDAFLNHPANPTHDRAVARELAETERENRAILQAEDARYSKWLSNMEHTTDIGTVRAEHYNMMRDIEKALSEKGLKMQASGTLQGMLREMASSSSQEGRSIVQRLLGGEKSARAAINEMFGKGYLENLLNVELRDPVIQASAAGKRIATLLNEKAINDEAQIRALLQQLLANPEWDPGKKSANPVAIELIQTIGELPGYAQAAHGVDRDELINKVVLRLYDSVGRSRKGVESVNKLIEKAIQYRMWRVGRAYDDAMSQGKTPDEAAAIAERALEVVYGPLNPATGKRSGGEIDQLQTLVRPLPDDDPTTLQVDHPPPVNPFR